MIAILVFALTLIYLSISVSAIIETDKVYYVVASNRSETNLKMAQINAFPYTISGAIDYSTLFVAWHTTQVIQDNTIVVAQLVIDNIKDYSSTPFQIGVGQLATGAITNTNNGAFYYDMPYDQAIISTTVSKISDGTRITVTFKANGFTNNYPFLRIYPLLREESGYVIRGVRYDLYESIEDAAGSGVTPEEMREVLSAWGEEELLPGIQDSVQSGVASGMEEALQNEKQEAQAGADEGVSQLEGAITDIKDKADQMKDAFTGLGNALSSSSTTAILNIPAISVPGLGQVSPATQFNLTGYIDSICPAELLLALRAVLTLSIISFPILELIREIQRLLK